jgi:hypothetical protein
LTIKLIFLPTTTQNTTAREKMVDGYQETWDNKHKLPLWFRPRAQGGSWLLCGRVDISSPLALKYLNGGGCPVGKNLPRPLTKHYENN